MTKISVIIPVYNTSKYLKECLDSVLNQSFEDFEIICVNDGSTDNSLEVLESYDDERITIINQENKGLAAARNIALTQAKGDYVLFIDSDDYIVEDSLDELYELARLKSADLIMFKLMNFDKDYNEIKQEYFEMDFLKEAVEGEVFSWSKVKNHIFDLSVTAPAKLFKRTLIKNIQFPEGLIFEDSLFFIKTIFYAKRVFFYDKHLYYRRLRNDSITKSYYKSFSDCIDIYDMIGKHLKRINVYGELSDKFFNRQCRDIFKRFTEVPEEFKKDYFDRIKEYFQKNRNSLKRDGVLDICSERSLEIFNRALVCDTYKEFELSVNLFDMKRKNDKLKLNYNMSKRSYKKQISKLEKKNEEYQVEIDDLKNSVSFKIIKYFNKLLSYFKQKLD